MQAAIAVRSLTKNDVEGGAGTLALRGDLAHKRGRAVVIVTHDSRVRDFADRIVRIEDGTIARPSEAEPLPAGLLVHGMGTGAVSFAYGSQRLPLVAGSAKHTKNFWRKL